jgi:hypothetical protein
MSREANGGYPGASEGVAHAHTVDANLETRGVTKCTSISCFRNSRRVGRRVEYATRSEMGFAGLAYFACGRDQDQNSKNNFIADVERCKGAHQHIYGKFK